MIDKIIRQQQKHAMLTKHQNLSPEEIKEFKTFLSQEMSGPRRKLTGDQMSKLKKNHFNEYIKKIKYYARKDLQKIKQSNMNHFYGKEGVKNYQNKQEATSIVKKQKPIISPEIKQPCFYYFGKAQLSSMKEFIFLAQQCHRIQKNLNKIAQRRRNSEFIQTVEEKVQHSARSTLSPARSLNLRLTLKSAQQIEQKQKEKQLNPEKFLRTQRSSFQSAGKNLGETFFTTRKTSSLASLRTNIYTNTNF